MTETTTYESLHRRPSAQHLEEVARRFVGSQRVAIEEMVAGHINFSWRLELGDGRGYLLQRVNHHVFHDPVALMGNVARVTRHVHDKLAARGVADLARRCLRLVPALDGELYHVEEEGWLYRLYDFIPKTATYVKADDPRRVEAAARAFGEFLADLADLEAGELVETIPRFHDTAHRFEQLDSALSEDPLGRVAASRAEIDAFFEQHCLLERLDAGALPRRVVHDDAKLTNVLFDDASDEALCVIDLDTVMPGLVCFDYGEMVRSMSHRFAEDEPDAGRVHCDLELALAISRGFVGGAAAMLTASERASLVDGGLLMTLENGVRFLADHLDGDRYYRVERPNQNLDRARAQLALLRSLRAQEDQLRETVERAWREVSRG
jgi:Ser/Thr protein kinase RdoA (MazF antagonist)